MKNLIKINKKFAKLNKMANKRHYIDIYTIDEIINFDDDIEHQFENMENSDILSMLNYIDDEDEGKRDHISTYTKPCNGLLLEVLRYVEAINYPKGDYYETMEEIILDFIELLRNDLIELLTEYKLTGDFK